VLLKGREEGETYFKKGLIERIDKWSDDNEGAGLVNWMEYMLA